MRTLYTIASGGGAASLGGRSSGMSRRAVPIRTQSHLYRRIGNRAVVHNFFNSGVWCIVQGAFRIFCLAFGNLGKRWARTIQRLGFRYIALTSTFTGEPIAPSISRPTGQTCCISADAASSGESLASSNFILSISDGDEGMVGGSPGGVRQLQRNSLQPDRTGRPTCRQLAAW